jgi:hypothetical protein
MDVRNHQELKDLYAEEKKFFRQFSAKMAKEVYEASLVTSSWNNVLEERLGLPQLVTKKDILAWNKNHGHVSI